MSETPPPPEPRTPPRRLAVYVTVPIAMLLGWGGYLHWRQASDARETLALARGFAPDVQVATVATSSTRPSVTLPGQTVAFNSADLFARATGFIAERHVDIGSRVKKGDLLIRIAAPDLDAQLGQARAQLGQMQAALVQAQASLKQAQDTKKLASINSYRASTLAREGWGTQQTADTNSTSARVSVSSVGSAQAGIGVAVANVRAQQASVDRLVALTGFERVTAPFDGVITQRDVDVGDLVQSDASSGTPLFHIDREDILRCDVYVPQSQIASIRNGLSATVTVPERPERVYHARISRSSASLAQNSRSMLVEIDIPNPDDPDTHLAPGLYVDVSLTAGSPRPVVTIPDSALIFDTAGLHVARVTGGQTIRMVPITLARDLGETAEVNKGLTGGEQIVVNPPLDLEPGQKVHVASSPHGKPGAKSS